jgi:hypothetical protein
MPDEAKRSGEESGARGFHPFLETENSMSISGLKAHPAVGRRQVLMALAAQLVRQTPERKDWTAEMVRAAQDAACAVLGLVGLAPQPHDYELGFPRVELMHKNTIYVVMRSSDGERITMQGLTISGADRENYTVALGALTDAYQSILEASSQKESEADANHGSAAGDGGNPGSGEADSAGRDKAADPAGGEGDKGGGDRVGGDVAGH